MSELISILMEKETCDQVVWHSFRNRWYFETYEAALYTYIKGAPVTARLFSDVTHESETMNHL